MKEKVLVSNYVSFPENYRHKKRRIQSEGQRGSQPEKLHELIIINSESYKLPGASEQSDLTKLNLRIMTSNNSSE